MAIFRIGGEIMSILSAIPIIGDLFRSVENVISQVVVDKDKANELTVKLVEIFKDTMEKYYDFIIKTEGALSDLAQFGIFGKLLAFLRVGWRPILQWGLVIDIINQRLSIGTPFLEMKEEIMFVTGLAVLRGVEKGLPFVRRNGNGK